MSHEIETAFFSKSPAWHGLGTVLDTPPTVEEAIIAAGLDWTVLEKPMYHMEDWEPTVIDGHKALVRSTDKKVLGVVSDRYHPLQNINAFQWFNFLLHEGEVTLEAAGSLKGGKRVWVLAKINKSAVDVGSGDMIQPYLLLHNSHDGTAAVGIQFTPVRVVCQNTLAYATQNERLSTGNGVRLRHNASLQENLALAQMSLNFSKQRFEEAVISYRLMAKKKVSLANVHDYFNAVWDVEDLVKMRKYDKLTDQLFANFECGTGNNGQTLWNAYQACTEFLTHQVGRSASVRLESSWFGQGATLSQRAYQEALKLV